MSNLIRYLKSAYLLSLNREKQERIVWNRLKKYIDDSDIKHGVYEKERRITAVFEISEGKAVKCHYFLFENHLCNIMRFLDNYPTDFTTELFILATHFNNLLNLGTVVINVNDRYVEYALKRELIIHALSEGAIADQISAHYAIANDIYYAFQRLVEENEAPAIIIADLLKKQEQQEN